MIVLVIFTDDPVKIVYVILAYIPIQNPRTENIVYKEDVGIIDWMSKLIVRAE